MVDGLISALPAFATDLLGRRPRKRIRISKKEKQELYEGVDKLIEAQKEIESFQRPAQSAAEYVSRMDRLRDLYAPFLDIPKGVGLAESLRDSYRAMTKEIGQWRYFPRTNYRKIAADLDSLTSAAFAKEAPATDALLSEFWNSADGAVIMRTPYTIVIRRCQYLSNANRKLDRKLVERLIETYRELSGLYEKAIRVVVGIMELLDGSEVTYGKIAKRSLALNVNKVAQTYPWLAKDFDITIRNSIAHTTYIVSYDTRTVTFIDNRTSVVTTFRNLFKRCRMLSSLAVGLLLLYVFFLYWRWRAVSDYYNLMKKRSRPKGSSC